MKIRRTVLAFSIGLILLKLFLANALYAETGVSSQGDFLLREGVEAFRRSDFQTAIFRFREILADPKAQIFQGDAYFWISRSYMALGRLEEASKHLEFFLSRYPDNPYRIEGLYEKGRLLYLQGQYGDSVEHLYNFVKQFPDSPYGPNAYYWIGEGCYALGRFREAEKIFHLITTQFPSSFRAEAARYRLDIIKLKYREEELLKFLQWSHEEYLRGIEELQKRETLLIETIKSYQRRIALLSKEDLQKELVKLSEQVRALEAELSQVKKNEEVLRIEKAALENALLRLRTEGVRPEAGIVSSASAEAATEAASIKNLLELLQIKQEALALKEAYLEKLKNEVLGTGGKAE